MASGFAPPKLADFILTEKLGSGTYATVYKAYRKGDNREAVAVKVVSKKSLNKTSMENLLTEIEILKTVRHPHIVQLKDFQWDSENIYLILEWCSGGDLSRFIRSRRLLPERVARRFLQQIACALQFLHERNISHLDLKPQNILLSGSVLKLADFGFAQYMSPWDEQSALRGSPLYMAPEIVCRRQYDARVDLWSVGVILYEALFGRPPFASRSYVELEEKIRSDRAIELPAGARVSRPCRDLLQRLLERNPDARISFSQFFSHPFVDMEHMPSAESLDRAKALVLQAVEKDEDGAWPAALSLYCSALEHFVPAIHYEMDRQRKEALRQKVHQYVSRAEELKALVASDNRTSFEEARSARDILREMSRDQPRVLGALEVAAAAVAKEESGMEDWDTLDLYQQSLGELLLALAGEAQGRRKELLHAEIKRLMTRAECLKEHLKMRDAQTDVSLDKEGLAESVRNSCCLQ
ncbi:serine/threonine-protein kinase ULK3 isoform X1 [Brienomyrus brachyistius]|uniref:serine/threonine-protein kinase ULK3 isoform X1 n=1 Tax=Brienomyrus brachyistius TaxID=42636 RepID=UPI0020B347BD|nr:serine/threonine-protein kinase ULK3 isoform X1 [Brienomyrus brachyistius]XP_048825283.1 serine/threonine-protein kinase ULK3 isoform X1 [Brienomyrus brachyistius]